MIKSILKELLLWRVKNRIRKCATHVGSGHKYSLRSHISLLDRAKPENVVLKENCWIDTNVRIC